MTLKQAPKVSSWASIITVIMAMTVIAAHFIWVGKELSSKASTADVIAMQVRIAQLEAHAANSLRWQDRIDLKLDNIDAKITGLYTTQRNKQNGGG
jgi:hypothetical protein